MENRPLDAHDFDLKAFVQTQPHQESLDHQARIPYLKVFGPDIGVFEFSLLDRSTTIIGCSPAADIRLPNTQVMPDHARVRKDGEVYTIEEGVHEGEFTVNGKAAKTHELRHGDSIQIAFYMLQFRTHPLLPGADEAAAQAKLMLRAEFCLLPSTMRLRYRLLDAVPDKIFASGDTLKVGHGGLLVPTPQAPDDCRCMELHMSWPNGASRRFLGENVGPIYEETTQTHWMCVKLHSVKKPVYDAVVAAGKPGEWVEVVET